MKQRKKQFSRIGNALRSIKNLIVSCSTFILGIEIIVAFLKQKNAQMKCLLHFCYERYKRYSTHAQFRQDNREYKKAIKAKKGLHNSSMMEQRLNCIKDTLNFNLCSQSDLLTIIKDIQYLKKNNPQLQSFTLSYSKMVFKTILQEKEQGNLIQLFSEFDYLNEILDQEQMTLNLSQLEIDYLFDERLETYYHHSTNSDYYYHHHNNNEQADNNNKNNQIDNHQQINSEIEDKSKLQNQIHSSSCCPPLVQIDAQIVPAIFIHSRLFVCFIKFQNYNFAQFKFQSNSNLEYVSALHVQNQSYISISNNLTLPLPSNILLFNSSKTFNAYSQSFLTFILHIKVFDFQISPYIHYLKQYTLMDLWLNDD